MYKKFTQIFVSAILFCTLVTAQSVSDLKTQVENASALIRSGEIEKATEVIKNLGTSEYNKELFEIRAGLLAGRREYKESVALINRVLDDSSVTSDEKTSLNRLKEYCLEKLDDSAVNTENVCHFCKIHLSNKSAYCPVCLQFQPQISEIKTKNARTKVSYTTDGATESVSYNYENKHNGMKAFAIGAALTGAVGGSLAGSAMSIPLVLKDPDKISKEFNFVYNAGIPQRVDFNADASKGGTTTSMIATSGLGDVAVGRSGRTETDVSRNKLQNILIYANNPNVDPTALRIAFGVNLSKIFYQSNFKAFNWNEPHIYSAEYSNSGQLVSAVDLYNYSPDQEGKYLLQNAYAFKNPYQILHSEVDEQWRFGYNDEGLLSSISLYKNGFEVYKKTISYNSQGIEKEVEESSLDKVNEFLSKVKEIKNDKEIEISKAKMKSKSEQEIEKIRLSFDSKEQEVKTKFENALKSAKTSPSNEIKYTWKKSTDQKMKLIKADGKDVEVTFK